MTNRDIERIPRQELGPKRCSECDWPLNPDGDCPRCANGSMPPCHVCGAATTRSYLVGVCPDHESAPYLLPQPDDAEAVERGAKAAFESVFAKLGFTWEALPEDAKDCHRQQTRAALAAWGEGK